MSGWIKLEKALRDDPRVLRMASRLRNADVTLGERSRALVVGALAQLWCYADTHVRQDDTLDLGPDELDDLVGVPGFARLLPADWLEIIDDSTVKLPNFHAHNGTESKKKALNQKRQERHRTNMRDTSVTQALTTALPDQDQTKTKTKTRPRLKKEYRVSSKPSACSPEVLTPVHRVFDHWRQTHGHEKAKLDQKRSRLIQAALQSYPADQLCQAISGYLNSPHHMGRNESRTVYDSIELMLRDAKHIDAGIKFHDQPPDRHLSKLSQANVDRTVTWVPPEMRAASGH